MSRYDRTLAALSFTLLLCAASPEARSQASRRARGRGWDAAGGPPRPFGI